MFYLLLFLDNSYKCTRYTQFYLYISKFANAKRFKNNPSFNYILFK